jgi:hypothetical protein
VVVAAVVNGAAAVTGATVVDVETTDVVVVAVLG